MWSSAKQGLARLARAINRLAPGLKRLLPKPVHRFILLHLMDANRAYVALPALASRRFMEREVLPWLRASCARILFVGTASYTHHYERLFRHDPGQFTTIDSNPAVAVWGAPQHIVAPIQEIGRVRPDALFDVVVLNGVFGFGVDDPATMADVIAAVHQALRPGGRLVLGWNVDLHADPATLGVIGPWFVPDEASPWGFRKTFDGEFHVNDFYARANV